MNQLPCPAADVIALDIGGANIKAADGLGWTRSEPFAMWRDWQRLSNTLARFMTGAPDRIVATMTGEIADCFPSRRAGVEHIVAALTTAASGAAVGIYTTDGRIVSPEEAIRRPLSVAAANWHAVARLAASLAPSDRTFLIDIGSTTTDVIPIRDGRPQPLATDDVGRMASGELVYTGIERTPIAAIVRSLPHRGVRRPVSSELFARSQDVWLMLRALPEDSANTDTADGEPATREASRIRLARTMLLEPDSFTAGDAERAAEWVANAQARIIARAVRLVIHGCGWEPTTLVISGHGSPLATRAISRLPGTRLTIRLEESLSASVSRGAPAHALALIARGMIR